MTHFRFRYKRVGFLRWRTRTARLRAMLLVLALSTASRRGSASATWRRAVPVLPSKAAASVLRIGEFTVGEEGDPQLVGHPDIRY